MSAIKKSDPAASRPDVYETGTPDHARLEDVSDTPDIEGPASPARQMQEELEQTMSGKSRRASRMDTGRVLAVSSGITTLLGVFIFTGIW